MILLALTAMIMVTDLGIKDIIESRPDTAFPKEIEKTGGMVVLRKSHNPGLPMGFLSGYPELVLQIPAAVTCAAAGIFAWLLPRKGNCAQKLGLAMIIGGSGSNLYDRFVRGYVVDYLNVRWKRLREVVFNLADVCILLGAFLFTAGELIAEFHDKK